MKEGMAGKIPYSKSLNARFVPEIHFWCLDLCILPGLLTLNNGVVPATSRYKDLKSPVFKSSFP
jgi:hypothetical protein